MLYILHKMVIKCQFLSFFREESYNLIMEVQGIERELRS